MDGGDGDGAWAPPPGTGDDTGRVEFDDADGGETVTTGGDGCVSTSVRVVCEGW